MLKAVRVPVPVREPPAVAQRVQVIQLIPPFDQESRSQPWIAVRTDPDRGERSEHAQLSHTERRHSTRRADFRDS